ncbi:MAG: hypothetical protein WKF78_00485 [Candidatus Limnocylindrales bacterium]
MTAIKVPNAVAPIDIEVNLRTKEVTTSVTLTAPREGRPATRINWLLRQLKDAPPALRISVRYPHTADRPSMLLRDADKASHESSAPDRPQARSLGVHGRLGTADGR